MDRLTLHLVLALLLAIQPMAGVARVCSPRTVVASSMLCCCASSSCHGKTSGCGCAGEAPPAPEPKHAEPVRHELAVVPVRDRLVFEGKWSAAPNRVAVEAARSAPRRASLCIWLT